MIDKPDPEDVRSPKFLIMNNTPLSLLGAIEALDWFFEPGCDVWITDLVLEEATREPGEGRDQASAPFHHRAPIRPELHWFLEGFAGRELHDQAARANSTNVFSKSGFRSPVVFFTLE